jgi:hypothetical protein
MGFSENSSLATDIDVAAEAAATTLLCCDRRYIAHHYPPHEVSAVQYLGLWDVCGISLCDHCSPYDLDKIVTAIEEQKEQVRGFDICGTTVFKNFWGGEHIVLKLFVDQGPKRDLHLKLYAAGIFMVFDAESPKEAWNLIEEVLRFVSSINA